MNFMGLGIALRWIWGMLSTPIGGGKPSQKDQLIELLTAQANANQTMITNHMAHMQVAMESMSASQKETADSLRENTATLKEIRNSIENGNIRLAHIEGRLQI